MNHLVTDQPADNEPLFAQADALMRRQTASAVTVSARTADLSIATAPATQATSDIPVADTAPPTLSSSSVADFSVTDITPPTTESDLDAEEEIADIPLLTAIAGADPTRTEQPCPVSAATDTSDDAEPPLLTQILSTRAHHTPQLDQSAPQPARLLDQIGAAELEQRLMNIVNESLQGMEERLIQTIRQSLQQELLRLHTRDTALPTLASADTTNQSDEN